MSSWTTTVPNSVRKSAPVGQTSRQPACVQCLHTLDIISQRKSLRGASSVRPGRSAPGMPRNCGPVDNPEKLSDPGAIVAPPSAGGGVAREEGPAEPILEAAASTSSGAAAGTSTGAECTPRTGSAGKTSTEG